MIKVIRVHETRAGLGSQRWKMLHLLKGLSLVVTSASPPARIGDYLSSTYKAGDSSRIRCVSFEQAAKRPVLKLQNSECWNFTIRGGSLEIRFLTVTVLLYRTINGSPVSCLPPVEHNSLFA